MKLDIKRGFYAWRDLTLKQANLLSENGYEMYKGRLTQNGGSAYFMVKKGYRESFEHALLVWFVADEIRKRRIPKVYHTVHADVSFTFKRKRICFEIETGSTLKGFGEDYIREKFEKRKQECDKVVVVVSNRLLKRRYKKLAKTMVITRAQVPQTVRDLMR